MPAVRQNPQHLPVPVLAEADGAHRVVGPSLGEGKLGVGVDDGRVEADGGVLVFGVVVFGDEDYTGEGNAVVVGGGVVRVLKEEAAAAAAAEVGGEDGEDGRR